MVADWKDFMDFWDRGLILYRIYLKSILDFMKKQKLSENFSLQSQLLKIPLEL